MDFFARQDQARRNTKLLVFYFVVAVVLIVLAVYLACALIFFGTTHHHRHGGLQAFSLWNPQLLFYVGTGTLSLIAGGTVYKTAALAGGGSALAGSLGGQLLDANTRDLEERKLLNVVEEMAIASGIPVPSVYVMNQENGINAFAAGYSSNDAVIGVTRGCIKLLSRDELQGVIAHEFSHILNGDMRLNLRLIGLVFGILCLTFIGRILLRTRGRKNPLPILGLALIAIGGLGVFFGRLIQAAVSRQREFLADASAVQFTRNPVGLSGALQKIGGLARGSRLLSEHASEACHLFFSSGLPPSFLNAMSTHPRLEDRIRAIDPSWNGEFPQTTIPEDESTRLMESHASRHVDSPPILGPRPQILHPATLASTLASSAAVLPHLGNPTSRHLRYAAELRNAFPESIRSAARKPSSAMALMYAMVLSSDDSVRASQLQQLAQQVSSTVYEDTLALAPDAAFIARRARLPLASLALPALRHLSSEEYQQFSSTLERLIESDQQIVLFEYVLLKIIRRYLEPQFVKTRPPVIQYYAIKPLLPDCAILLSALAYAGGGDETQIENAFLQGIPFLQAPAAQARLLAHEDCGLAQVDAALTRLAQASFQIKKNIIEACAHVVSCDGVIQEVEAELLRAVSDTLECPIPPFIPPDEAIQDS